MKNQEHGVVGTRCPVCGNKFKNDRGLRSHASRMHKDVFRLYFPEPQYYKPEIEYDEETMQELEERSNKNLLRMFTGNLSSFTFNQRKTLKQQGLVKKQERRGQRLEFSKKALQILEELENE